MTKQKSTAVYLYYVYVHNIDIIILYELCRDRHTNNIYSDTDSLVIFCGICLFRSLNGMVPNENP